jgi:two-component system, sensor histidine kinase and response regulator
MIRDLLEWLDGRLNPGKQALRRSQARYADLFNHVPDGVYESLPDGTIVAANPALVRMLGYTSEDELKAECRAVELYVRAGQRDEMTHLLETEGEIHNAEISLYRKDGSVLTVLENARVVRDERGRVVCYQGTMTDITERKLALDEVRRARDEALEASRLKNRFLANISHEVRTPLNGVLAMAQLLAGSPLQRDQAECVGTIEHSARFLLDLINEILDFSCIEAGKLELDEGIFRVRDVVEETAALVAPRGAAKGLCIVTSIDPALPELVSGDGSRVRQVLTNLAVNAVKFTDHGEVTLLAGTAPELADGVRFSVRDTGIGIDTSAHEIIFEPFRQADGSTKRRFGGTGLGLAIARQIAERMGGSLTLQSRPGEGATFTFTVPLPTAPGCRPAPVGKIHALVDLPVLLAEPRPAARAVIAGWLERWGARVVACNGGGPAPDAMPAIAVAAEELIAAARQGHAPAFLPPGVPVVLLGPVRAGQSLEAWAADRVSRPVRELALLDAMLRATGGAVPRPRSADLARFCDALGRKEAPQPARARILAAEDNQINQLVIRRLVQRLGYEIDIAASGHEAVAAAAAGGYAIVLMDCQMPDMDGFEATAAIRALPGPANRIPVIAVTAHATPGDRERCLAAGMDDYLPKPILLNDLAQVLERWIAPPVLPGPSPWTA